LLGSRTAGLATPRAAMGPHFARTADKRNSGEGLPRVTGEDRLEDVGRKNPRSRRYSFEAAGFELCELQFAFGIFSLVDLVDPTKLAFLRCQPDL